MTQVLWAGSETEAFDFAIGNIAASTSAANYDANFARASVDIGSQTRLNKVGLGSVAEVWLHSRWGGASTGATANGRSVYEFRNASGQGVLRLWSVTTGFRLEYWSGAAWTAIGADFAVTTINGRTWDIKCHIDNTAGEFAVYVDGTLTRSLTGDTDFFVGSAIEYCVAQSWGATNERQQSEMIMADDSTLGMRLATLVPTGNGANTAWTGTFADVDEAVVSDADFINSVTAAQEESFTLSNLSVTAAALAPIAVINSARARNGATGPQNIKLGLRTNSLDFYGSNQAGLGTSFLNGYQQIWNTNPDTTTSWTTTEIDALEVAVESAT